MGLAIAAMWVVPGTFLARLVAGQSWLRCITLSPALSVLLLSFAGAILGLAGIPATLLSTTVLLALGLGLTTFLLRHRVRNRGSVASDHDGVTLLGAGVASLLAATVWGPPPTWVAQPPQTWDYLWHQYVVATISRRGLLGPQNLVPIDGLEETIHTYQHGAHLAAGLVVGEGVPSVASGLNLTLWLAVVVFLPLGAATLTRSLTDNSAAALFAPALLVLLPNGVFSTFGLFAFAVGLSLLASIMLAGVIHSRESAFRSGLLLTLAMTGLLLIHAHVFLAAAILLAFLWAEKPVAAVIGASVDDTSGADAHKPWFHSGSVFYLPVLAAFLLASPWLLLATGVYGSGLESGLATAAQVREPGFATPSTVLGLLIAGRRLGGYVGSAANSLFGVAMLLGALYLCWRRKHVGLALSLFILTYATALVAGGSGRLRYLIALPWLGDWWRLAAILSFVGALVIALALGDATSRISSAESAAGVRVGLAASLVIPLGIALLGQLPEARTELAGIYGPLEVTRSALSLLDDDTIGRDLASDQPLMVISPLEVHAMGHLAEITPVGTRVLNWWGDGSPWMYSAAGLVPVRTYGAHSVSLEDAFLVEAALGDPNRYNEAVEALATLGVCSAYTAAGRILSERLPAPPTWTQIIDLPGFELVYRNEHARVYRAADPHLTENC